MKKKKLGFANVSGLFSEEERAGAQQISDILELSHYGTGTCLA
jgi:hypothetical protein